MRNNYDIPPLGIGIKIISQIADELSYTRNYEHRNCLLIVKYFQPVLPQYSTRPGYLKKANEILEIFNWLKEQKNSQSDRTSDMPLQKNTLQLTSDVTKVTQILWWSEQLHNLPIPASVLQLCKLACVEGFIQALHQHKNMPSGTPIDLAISVFDDRLQLQIWDWGKPLNFQEKLNKVLQYKDPFGLKELGFEIE